MLVLAQEWMPWGCSKGTLRELACPRPADGAARDLRDGDRAKNRVSQHRRHLRYQNMGSARRKKPWPSLQLPGPTEAGSQLGVGGP